MKKFIGKIKNSWDDILYDAIGLFFLIFIVVIILYPLYFILIASFSDPDIVNSGKIMLYPEGITWSGYERVFQDKKIWSSYGNTIFYTVFGSLFGTVCTIMAGYALSRNDLPGNGIIMKLLVFTMYFSGGMIPLYLMIQSYHLLDTRFLMIVLSSIQVFNIIIVRTNVMHTIPQELFDAATIDGCGHGKFFTDIVIPLSKPIIAVIVLYVAVSHWNSYFNAMMYLTDGAKEPLQVYLREILMYSTTMAQSADLITDPEQLIYMQKTATQLKYSVIIVSVLPILCVYPFIQKYFVKGVMVGAVKG